MAYDSYDNILSYKATKRYIYIYIPSWCLFFSYQNFFLFCHVQDCSVTAGLYPPKPLNLRGIGTLRMILTTKPSGELTINKNWLVDQLDRSNCSTLTHPIYTRDMQLHATFNSAKQTKYSPTKTSSHPHILTSSHVSLNILSCMSPMSVSAADSGRIWPSMLNHQWFTRSSLPLRLPIFAASAGVCFEFYIYRRPSLGWNFRWNCSTWDRPCDDWPSNVKCWWIQLHKKGEAV